MGLFLCDLCGEEMSLTSTGGHACSPEQIRQRVRLLEDRAHKAERQLDGVDNAVRMLLHELPSLDGGQIPVSGDWLRRLYATVGCHGEEATADLFLVRWMATHFVLSQAFALFRSRRHGRLTTPLERLRELREACDQARVTLGYEKSSPFDLRPEDLA